MNLNELKDKAARISDKVFGERPAIGPIKKLKSEVDELLECLEKGEDPGEEFADCFVILLDAYRKHYGDDVDTQKLIDDSSDKLDVLLDRNWEEVEEGVFQHIKEDEELPWEKENRTEEDIEKLKDIIKAPPVGLDTDLIQKAYDEILDHVVMDMISSELRNKIKKMMGEKLPFYEIKCDQENNPFEIVDAGNVWVRVTNPKTKSYIDVVF